MQTKGRARSAKAYYFLLVSRRDTSDYLTMMAEFHAIEKVGSRVLPFSFAICFSVVDRVLNSSRTVSAGGPRLR